MQVPHSVHIHLFNTQGESKIDTETYSTACYVRVYINTNGTLDQHKLLLPTFAQIILGKQLASFEVTDLPLYIDNLFRFVLRQINNGVLLSKLVDEQGQLLFFSDASIEPRFTENRQGATKEIIVNNVILDEVHEINKDYASLQYLHEHKTLITDQIMHNLVDNIREKKTTPPSFTKKTKANIRKIKNYIYHHTKLWLSKKEIEIFIYEINKQTKLLHNNNLPNTLE